MGESGMRSLMEAAQKFLVYNPVAETLDAGIPQIPVIKLVTVTSDAIEYENYCSETRTV